MKKTIIDYFENTVEKFPGKVAVTDQERQITFKELQIIALNIGADLLKKSIKNRPVAIYMKQNVKVTAAMLGVLYTDNFYVVLDYDSPKERIEKILKTLNPCAVIYEKEEKETEDFLEQLKKTRDITPVKYQEKNTICENQKDKIYEIKKNMTLETPAYGLFTSGSTGDPKGVLVTHGNVISYMGWFTECFSIDEKTSFAAQTPLYFSMSVSDFFGSMFTGATYNMIPKEYFAFPAKLIGYINEKKANTIYWVPSAMGIFQGWDLFKYAKLNHIEKVLFAGEAMTMKYLNYWREHLPNAMYANLFGPTETTDICTYYKVDRDFKDTETLPIGGPCDNCQLIIINPDTETEAKNGEKGELYVKSPFVAKGYYKNPEKTKEAFVQNPLHKNYPDTVYKTGDLVYLNSHGELEYAGRKDHQIKHMGYRIELGEIENVLNTASKDIICVCVYNEKKDQLILVYQASNNLEGELTSISSIKLPVYMQPEKYEKVECLPVNQNGKLDRKAIKKLVTEN